MRRTTTSVEAATRGQPDMLRMRKELINARSKIQDLTDELEEKTSLYLNCIKQRDDYKEKLDKQQLYINRFDEIVEKRVHSGLERERQELEALRLRRDTWDKTLELIENQKKMLEEQNKKLMVKLSNLQEDNKLFQLNNDTMMAIKRIDALRRQLEERTQERDDYMREVNKCNNYLDQILTENRALRRMAGVSDDYGIDIASIILRDRETIEDFKRQNLVLEEFNEKLEKERMDLKEQIRILTKMYASNETDPRLRYRGLSNDQLIQIDAFVLRLIQGDPVTPEHYYRLKKEYDDLLHRFEQGLGPININGDVGITNSKLQQLINDNAELRSMILELQNKGLNLNQIIGDKLDNIGSNTTNVNINRTIFPGHLSLVPRDYFDGEVDMGEKHGHNQSSVKEHAFLQIQLVEVYRINEKLQSQIGVQKEEIEGLYTRIRDYIWVQDQLYKDYIRLEKNFKQEENEYKKKIIDLQNSLQEERVRATKSENALKTFNSGDVPKQMIELSKENAILDHKLLKLTRKYNILDQDFMMLKREYHSRDSDNAEKDIFVQERINKLKEWKAKALTHIQLIFHKLKESAPLSELETKHRELEKEKTSVMDLTQRNEKLSRDYQKLRNKERKYAQADHIINEHMAEIEMLTEEMENLKSRLESKDPTYKWENEVFQKVANLFKRLNVSPLQAFREFDVNKDGILTREEMFEAFEIKIKMKDLTRKELNVIFNAIDFNYSGKIDYIEFARKLERFGVKNLGREEYILYSLAKQIKRMNMNVDQFFSMADQLGNGIITPKEFKNIFKQCEIKVADDEFELFMNHFWRDSKGGIDYKQFLTVLTQYQIKMAKNLKRGGAADQYISDETIIQKKQIYTALQDAFIKMNKSINNFFNKVDKDGSGNIDANELYLAFKAMEVDVTPEESAAIFSSIDFDGNYSVSMNEMIADYKETISKEIEELLSQNRERNSNITKNKNYNDFFRDTYTDKLLDPGRLREIEYEEIIRKLKFRESNLQKQFKKFKDMLTNSEKINREIKRENNQLIEQNDLLTNNKITQDAELKRLQELNQFVVRKEEAKEIRRENEMLKTNLAETKAAMLSYKNMYGVMADQVKSLQLVLERKKDEHENLMEALREVQSEDLSKERIGKLYFIIMLSRWQEAAVNKKYDAVVHEVKSLRNEVLSNQALLKLREDETHRYQEELQQAYLRYSNLKHKLEEARGVFLHQSKADEFRKTILNLTDEINELAEEDLIMKGKLRDQMAEVQRLTVEQEANILQIQALKQDRNEQISQRIIDVVKNLKDIKLSELRERRLREELQNKVNYQSSVIKKKDQDIDRLELEASKLQADVINERENFIRRDNERIKELVIHKKSKFNPEKGQRFYSDDSDESYDDGPNFFGQADKHKTFKRDMRVKKAFMNLNEGVSKPKFPSGQNEIDQNMDFYYSQQKEHDNTIKQMARSRNRDLEEALKGREYEENMKGKDSLISNLNAKIDELTNLLTNKNNEIKMYRVWKEEDQYLSKDDELKDAVEKQRIKTVNEAQIENKELADAAYQTIKTLQDMIDQKNNLLKTKDEQLQKMRETLKAQAESDAIQINKLKGELSLAGNSALNKLQQIVQKQENTVNPHTEHLINKEMEFMKIKELEDELLRKDNEIARLNAGKNTAKKGEKNQMEITSQLRNQISVLQGEVARLTSENRQMEKLKKDILKMQKTIKDKDDLYKNLSVSLEKQKDLLVKQTNEIEQFKEDNKRAKEVQKVNEGKSKADDEVYKVKLELITASRDNFEKENKTLKVALSQEREKVQNMKEEVNKSKEKEQQLLETISREQNLRRIAERDLKRYKDENKVGGNVGIDGVSFDGLMARNKQLEQENRVLEGYKHLVVARNNEFGTFEFIGQPASLMYEQNVQTPRSALEVVQAIKKWLQKHDRLTWKSIFKSMDSNLSGSLTLSEFMKAFQRIGLVLNNTEKELLQQHLDATKQGLLKYEPLLLQLEDIPTIDFVHPTMKKLAMLMIDKDYLPHEFEEIINAGKQNSMDFRTFKEGMERGLRRSDFEFSDAEIESAFQVTTNVKKILSTSTIVIEEFVKNVYEAVKACTIEMMKRELDHSRKFIADLLVKYDTNKDGFLTYSEFDNLLSELQTGLKPKVAENCLRREVLDKKRHNKINCELVKMIVGQRDLGLASPFDMVPSKQSAAGQQSITQGSAEAVANAKQRHALSLLARKVMIGFGGMLGDNLMKADVQNEGLVQIEKVEELITQRNIQDLTVSELNQFLKSMDSKGYGFIVISNFMQKIVDLASETETEVKMRRFAKNVGNQGLNLKQIFFQFDSKHTGRLDAVQFKRAMKQLAISLTDQEIKDIYDYGVSMQREGAQVAGLDIGQFNQLVSQAFKQKPLPQYLSSAPKPSSKFGKGGLSAGNQAGTVNQFENWELEKKYKKNLEALKQEIEERNNEILIARKEVQDVNVRVLKLEQEKQNLETRLVDKNSRPPREMSEHSKSQGAQEEIQKLKDEIFHLQQVNQTIQKTVMVSMKSEMKQLAQEKDKLEEKLKNAHDKLRTKTHDLEMIIGEPPTDAIGRREEALIQANKDIEDLKKELVESEVTVQQLRESLFRAEEKNLDLKFEKETFDLQYARLQKRINDLEEYKLKSSQISANLKNQREEELAAIREQTTKLTGEEFSKRPGDSVKLRNKPTKSVAELETVIDTLSRVIEKQKVELDTLRKENSQLSERVTRGANEPELRKKIDSLSQALHSAQMKEVNTEENERNLKKVISANKQLREDLNRELDRYNLLEQKFRDLLKKYNIVSQENEKNKQLVFAHVSGAHFRKYENYLDSDNNEEEQPSVKKETKKRMNFTSKGFEDDLDDDLNRMAGLR